MIRVFKQTLLTLTGIAALSGATAAMGQAADAHSVGDRAGQDGQLPPVTVRAGREAPVPWRPSVREEQSKLDAVPGGSNLVAPQAEARLATLRDALDHQPGIVIQDFFGGTDQPRLNLRGSGIQSNPVNRGVLLLQDGVPLNEADGSFIIGLLEPRDAALISVRRGGNARHAAASTLGGEIDFLSLTGADEQARARLEAGSFGRAGLQLAGGWVGEALDARLSASADRYDGYRHHSASQRDALRGSVGFRGDGGFENRSHLSWTDLRFQIPAVVPKARVSSDPRSVMGDGNSPQDTLLNVYKRDPRREASQLRLANRSRWGHDDLRQELGLLVQDSDDLFNNQTSHTVTASRTLGAQWRLDGRVGAAGQSAHQLGYRAALSWQRSDMDRDLYATSPQTGQALQRFGSFDLQAANQAFLVGGDWRPAQGWMLTADLQWARMQRDARNTATAAVLAQRWSGASPKLGVTWQAAPATQVFANVSRSHEAPTFWEIVSSTVPANNPAAAVAELVTLKLQRATTVEVGARGQWPVGGSAPQWSLSLYRSEVDDELMSTTDANGVKVGTYNYAGGTRHQGLEAGLQGRWPLGASALDYRVAWTYSDFRFKGGEYAGKAIAGVPRYLVSGEVLWQHGGWRVGPVVLWLPTDTPTDHANTAGSEQDAYALLGLKLEWRGGPWTAYLLGDNLTDRRYASSYAIRNRATPDQPGYLPGLGRNLSAGLSYAY
jgi:iron complex outermembrane receptor protein